MDRRLKNRIISFFTAFIMVAVLFLSPMIAFSEETKDEYRHQSFELYPNGKESEDIVTLEGMMPKGVKADAVDVTEDFLDEDDSDSNKSSEVKSEEKSKSEVKDSDSSKKKKDKKADKEKVSDYATLGDASPGDADSTEDYVEEIPEDTEEQSVSENMQEAEDDSNKDKSSEDEYTVVCAYDITITDGDSEYQPDEKHPVAVEIVNSGIKKGSNLKLWHIKDDGEIEEIENFTVEDGKVSFDALGFSVYEIVEGPSEYEIQGRLASSVDELTGSDTKKGFYLYYGGGNYITNQLNSKDCFIETTALGNASVWYFEKDLNDNDKYYIYTYVGEDKLYVNNKSGNLVELHTSNKTAFTISQQYINGNDTTNATDAFYIKKYNENKWLQHSGSGGGIRLYTDAQNATNSQIKALFVSSLSIPDDQYKLDGKSYGLVYYTSGSVSGRAMMSEANNSTQLKSKEFIVKNDPFTYEANSLFVSKDSDMSMWEFHSEGEDKYTISTSIDGVLKYLKLDSQGLYVVDKADATTFTVIPGTGNNEGKIKLTASGRAIRFNSTFRSDTIANGSWLDLTKESDYTTDDFVVYSAKKVGVSDYESVKNGSSVIVYTRVWDDSSKSYKFYAVDRDGSLVPCYERGDNIMWVGSQINTFLWDFTEYYYEGTTIPNYYYELYNPYSEKYLAPQIEEGQVLSDNTIGINLPGRRDGEYYTDILAWDDPNYKYAALMSDMTTGKLKTTDRHGAETFYFAIMESEIPTLTPVTTIDNDSYGITMKMVDFTDRSQQNAVLGTTAGTQGTNTLPGILSTDLKSNGYPTTLNGKSLSELYAEASDVNHLFIESTYNASGYFEYDSCQNFASLKGKTGGDFTVYKEIGTMNTRGNKTDKHGQFMPYNDITAGVYSTVNPENINDVFGDPLPEDDPRKYEPLHLVGNKNNTDATNWNFGMELGASFVQTPSGKDAWGHDIIFEFTGDDDFWLYVDGELIIDLGGIHSALAGKVNFSTGEVVVNGNKTTIRALLESNYRARKPGATDEEVNDFLAKHFDGDETIFKEYSSHTMKIFYMERGEGASNLHMRFNLNYVTPGSVFLSKEVTGTEALDEDVDFSLVEYPFQIWYKANQEDTPKRLTNDTSHLNVTYQNSTQKVEYRPEYTPPKTTISYKDVYFLSPGMVAEIHFPETIYSYQIVECGINTEVYDDVSVPGVTSIEETVHPENNIRASYTIPWATVEERNTVAFNNHIDKDGLRSLTIEKKLLDENGNEISAQNDPTTFSFRLYLTNGADNNLELANMYKYRVLDPDGYLCRWSSADKTFVSTDKKVYKELSDVEKKAVTFETSMNGAISKIPAGYSVEVPGLPVGTLFKVEEKDSEIPLGYKLVKYDREGTSYQVLDGDTPNSGRIRAEESPSMTVVNRRGWEIEATKEWSDKAYTKSHDTVYTAVYVGDSTTPLDGTVKAITPTNSSVRYYFDKLQSGHTFDDYKVYEVILENPSIQNDGTVTYSSVTKAAEGVPFNINATANNSDTPSPFPYAPTYEQGTAVSSVSETSALHNVRNATVTNTRTGGVVVTLYDMSNNKELADGTFTLKKKLGDDTYEDIGTYTSDKNGRVTILYEFDRDTDYVITETASPKGYIGLPNPVTFSIAANNDVTVNGNGNGNEWQNGAKFNNDENLVAYINVYNKPFTIEVYKFDGETNGTSGLSEAHFSLYRGRVSGKGTIVKDYVPLYEDMVTDEHGLISEINQELASNTYFLTEKTPPPGYKGLDEDVVFEISPTGGLTIISPLGSGVEMVPKELGATFKYLLNIPNSKDDVKLTVTKNVTGTMADKEKEFTFTFSVDNDSGGSYSWAKNNLEETTKLSSGSTFTLKHGENVIINVPAGKDITITEDAEDYTPSFKLGSGAKEDVSTKTFSLNSSTVLAVTNTLDGPVLTGIKRHSRIAMIFIILLAAALAAVNLNHRRLVSASDDDIEIEFVDAYDTERRRKRRRKRKRLRKRKRE